MNIRKPVDHTEMYTNLDVLMAAGLPQMELYREIGKAVSQRPEKGAAVAAAEYLQGKYPDASGFSPRNLRRMREFYRAYESSPALLDEAMKIGWTQNVVIMESGLSLEEKGWYIKAVHVFGWSKLELVGKIAERAHETMILSTEETAEHQERLPHPDPSFASPAFDFGKLDLKDKEYKKYRRRCAYQRISRWIACICESISCPQKTSFCGSG